MSMLQVSLPETIHTAQMRFSIALALSSSGAILSASNKVSRLGLRWPWSGRGKSLGGFTQLGEGEVCGALCAKDGVAAGNAVNSTIAQKAGRPVNRQAMTMSLTAEHGTARPKSAQSRVNEPKTDWPSV